MLKSLDHEHAQFPAEAFCTNGNNNNYNNDYYSCQKDTSDNVAASLFRLDC